MSFAQGAAIGQRTREQRFPMASLSLPENPAATFAALTPKAPRVSARRPAPKPSPLEPSAIHRRAAELALQEKELDVQKSALELEKLKEANALARDDRRRAIEREPFEKSALIEGEYQNRLKGIGMGEGMERERQQEAQSKDFKGAMLAAHLGNGASLKEFINKHGSPGAKVADVTFDPSGSGEVIIKYEDGKSSLFKSPEQLYKGLLFFMDPKSVQALASMKKAEKDEVSVKDRHSIMKDLETSYKDQFSDPAGNIKKDAPNRDTWLKEKYKERTGRDYAEEGPAEKAGAIKKPTEEGAEEKPPVAGARRAPDGQWYVQTKEGWRPVVKKGESVAPERERVKPGEPGSFDYQTGRGTPARDNNKEPYSVVGAERARGKINKGEKQGEAESEAPRGGAASATFTDPKTGEKVTVTYDSSGKRTEKREKKDKKKDDD